MIWGDIWKHTVEKIQTNATNAHSHSSNSRAHFQHTVEFSQTNAIIVEKTFSWCRTCFVISVSVTRLNWRGPWVPGQRRLDAQDESMWKSSCRIFLGRKSVSNYCHPLYSSSWTICHLCSISETLSKQASDMADRGQGRQKYQLWMYFSVFWVGVVTFCQS